MGIIRKLEPDIIKRIAAGEVIERPASVVKELVENCLDAGASRISVELANGGMTLIKVTDNGIGIAAEDIPVLMERHVTSKINNIDDLDNVGTLGFRGEALYSIATVAKFTLRTRRKGEDAGSELTSIDGSRDIKTIAHPVGTSIDAASLFFNTPARRKFMKTSSAEYSRCAEVVTRFALAYPQVAFDLIHDGRINLQSTGAGVHDVLLAVFGKDEAKQFISVMFRDQTVGVRGQISGPGLTRSTRKDQTFTINGRVVADIALNMALERAYARVIQEGKKPLCILDVSIDPGSVDVNVHPHKREVRMVAPHQVYDAIQRACSDALRRELEGDGVSIWTKPPETAVEETSFVSFRPKDRVTGTAEEILEGIAPLRLKYQDEPLRLYPRGGETSPSAMTPPPLPTGFPIPAASGEIIQYEDTYLIVNGGDAIYIADQHNLHETILYRTMRNASGGGKISQKLLFPVTVEFTPEVSSVVESKLGFLSQLGYELEPFGGGAFIVRSLPAFLRTDDPKGHLLELFDEVGDLKGQDFEEAFIVNTACKAAIKAGMRLSDEEMRTFAGYMVGKRGFNCPHGRPALIVLDIDWFSHAFKRPVR